MQERVIGSSFKVLAHTYLTVQNFDTLKQTTAARIRALNEETFQMRYAPWLRFAADLPPYVQRTYNLEPPIDQEQALDALYAMDKDKAGKLIDQVPDSLITRRFYAYLSRIKPQGNTSVDVMQELKKYWEKITSKLDK